MHPLKPLLVFLMLAVGVNAQALPVGGVVAAGAAQMVTGAGSMTITQSSQNAVINWQSFNSGHGETIRFVQPNSQSVALNRVVGADRSNLLGNLFANGNVFLINPNGILFGPGASVNVGGLVASTRNISDSDFMAGNYRFTGSGAGAVINQGSISAEGGYVALLGARVSNEGIITARLGTVALAAGNAITLDVAGDGLLNVTVNEGAVNALVQNSGLIQADGGQVLLSAQAAGGLLATVVNNTGVIQAQSIGKRNGRIVLLGDMQNGTVNVSGTLDASAPDGSDGTNGTNGGFIETSAAQVTIANDAMITTAAAHGLTGTWLIDPQDFIIGIGGNISGAALSALLVTNSVIISTNIGVDSTVAGAPPVTSLNTSTVGNGDIFVNQAVAWTAAPSTTTLTLNAARDVNINQAITATNGNLVVCCGRDINVSAAITTTNGSLLLSAGHDLNVSAAAAITATDGNITMCVGRDISINLAAITLTRGSLDPAQSLGLTLGLMLSAGNEGSGPGVAGGTLLIAPATPPAAITGPNAAVTINYNPSSYATPTNYAANFTLSGGATLNQNMLVFPDGASKTFDGSTVASFTGLKGNPVGVALAGAGTAAFDSATVGLGKTVTFSGFTLVGAAGFALPLACCGPAVGRTTSDITAAPPVVIPPVVIPPVVIPPAVIPPAEISPVALAPVEIAPLENPPVEAPSVDIPPLSDPLVGQPTWMPIVVTPVNPPELASLFAPPPSPPRVPAQELPPLPPQTPANSYAIPLYAPKPDRN